jgi:exonuclease SbcD
MLNILHFADAHIDMANYGRHDPETGLPMRVMDFLKSLDEIVDTAIDEQVDLVIFAGDTYKDRSPAPTFQREWGRRIMRLSQAGIPTLLLVGNHDVAPASGRAHTLQEFKTLDVPHIHVADTIRLWTPDELGLPVQVITIPWVPRSRVLHQVEQEKVVSEIGPQEMLEKLEEVVELLVERRLMEVDPELTLILTAHASVQGAKWGSERAVMLGQELVLGGSLVNDSRLDYVALGHIHKHQSINGTRQPPVVYPGSIERVDFGEAHEDKGFVLASVSKGHTEWQFVKLNGRRFLDPEPITPTADNFMADILNQLPTTEDAAGAICRIRLTYPRDQEPLLDEQAIYDHLSQAFEVHLRKHHLQDKRSRLGDAAGVEEMAPEELLEIYWDTIGLEAEEAGVMQTLAKEFLAEVET